MVSHILLLVPPNSPVPEEGSCAEITEQGSLQPLKLNFLSLTLHSWPDPFISFILPMLYGFIEAVLRFPFALCYTLCGFPRSSSFCHMGDKTVIQLQALSLFTELGKKREEERSQ